MRITVPIWFIITLHLYSICSACIILNTNSGSISNSYGNTYVRSTNCWIIPVPSDSYVTIQLSNLQFKGSCSYVYLKTRVAVTNISKTFCGRNYPEATLFRALNNVTILYVHDGTGDWYRKSSIALKYTKESIICTHSNNFRCSSHQCIHKNRVCDRIDDCEDASDENNCDRGIASVEGINKTQATVTKWLMEKAVSYGWEKNTHRAITALYLSQVKDGSNVNMFEKKLKKELEIKQLELKTLVALLRNSTEPISLSDLSMFVNALLVTCHNPRQFHGHDLIKILYERVSITKAPCPGAYLTLCNSNWILSLSDVTFLLELLEKNPNFPFLKDVQAMTIMALSCIKNKYEEYKNLFNDSSTFNETIETFLESQLPDGSFGNVYTTAMITQALISSGQETNKKWNVTSTGKYFTNYFDSETVDFLSVYLALPLFSSRSFVDIGKMSCSNSYRKQENDISDVAERLDKKMFIQYSLFIGDEGEIIHTIYLKIPKNSSVYDLMRVAQAADPKYKFLYRFMSGQMYVYQIADITNDPEAGKFWLLYTKDNELKTVKSHTESPDKLILKDGEHLVMWYKTAMI